MSLLSVAAQNASLNMSYGASRGSLAPAAHQVALFTDHPDLGGVELDSVGGYARVVFTNNGTNWPGAADGQTVSANVVFAAPTAEWTAGGVPDTATYAVLFDNADGTTTWDAVPLSEEIDVSGAGGALAVQLTVNYVGSLA